MSHAPVPPGDSPVILSGSPVILSVSEGSLSHDIADYPAGIVIPIDKPYRWTSADVIRKVKFAAFRHFRKKNLKVGHAGTLDPLATGVLLICIGAACKRAQEFQDHDKEYVAGIRFGATTPSYDLEKEVDRTFPYEHITEEAVRKALKGFLGPQEQIAPLFSAKSVDGVRAYELARKLYRKSQRGDLDPDFDAAALETLHRGRITISDLELLGFDPASAVPAQEVISGGNDLSASGVGQNFFDLFSGEKVLVRGGTADAGSKSSNSRSEMVMRLRWRVSRAAASKSGSRSPRRDFR